MVNLDSVDNGWHFEAVVAYAEMWSPLPIEKPTV